jgi:hypothetical protein
MTYIITPPSDGWGDWKELAHRANLVVTPEHLALGDKLLLLNPCEKVEEEYFQIVDPLTSSRPAELFFKWWGMEAGYKTLHPLPTLAALAEWKGATPSDHHNLASPHLLSDEKGENFILCICGDANGAYPTNRLRFLPTTEYVYRPAFFVGLESERAQRESDTRRIN